jgi:hypothetical protein
MLFVSLNQEKWEHINTQKGNAKRRKMLIGKPQSKGQIWRTRPKLEEF